MTAAVAQQWKGCLQESLGGLARAAHLLQQESLVAWHSAHLLQQGGQRLKQQALSCLEGEGSILAVPRLDN